MLSSVPAIIYLFVILSGPVADRPDLTTLHKTADKAACEAMAAEWNKLLAAQKAQFACLPYQQKVFSEVRGSNQVD